MSLSDQTRLTGFTADVLRDVLDTRVPSAVVASPDGARLAIVAGRRGDDVKPPPSRRPAGQPHGITGQHVHVTELDSRATTEVLAGAAESWGPSWNPDGTLLALYALHEGNTAIWLWDAASTAATRLATPPLVTYHFPVEWTADGKALLLLVPDEVPQEPEPPQRDGNGVTVLFSPRRDDGPLGAAPVSLSDGVNSSVVRYDVATGEVQELIAGLPAYRITPSPDGRWIAVQGHVTRPRMDSFATVAPLRVYDSTTGEQVIDLPSISGGSGGLAWDPDSRRIALVHDGSVVVHELGGATTTLPGPGTVSDWVLWSADGRYLLASDSFDETARLLQGAEGPSRLWALHLKSGEFHPLALPEGAGFPKVARAAQRAVFWADGSGRAAVVTRDLETRRRQLHWVPLDGSAGTQSELPPWQLPSVPGVATPVDCTDVSADGVRLFYRAEDETHLPEIWQLDRSGRAGHVTRFNEGLGEWGLPPAQTFTWEHEGDLYRGALLLPPGHDGTSPVPVVVDTYPMPHWSDWFDDWEGTCVVFRQLLLAEGYAVFIPSRTVLPMPAPFARTSFDGLLVAGLDELVRRGLADDRVAVMGQSLGGYMVHSVITTSTRFRAAVSGVGVGNLSSWFGQVHGSEVTHGVTGARNLTGGAPFEQPSRYVEESPVFHLDKVETPLLIFHGDADSAAVPQQGHEMYVGLKYRGREVTQLTYHGEGHGPMSFTEPNRTHLIEQALTFLHRHLAGPEGRDSYSR